ncbi:Thermoresistant gluconokinase [compost metagenome]
MSLKRVDTGASKPSESPQAIVVMGVAGCGKSSVACLIAKRFGGVLIEGDSFHSQECIQKMRDGIPLTDIDRAAWLAQLNEALLRAVAADELPVLACSALKARYRDILGTGLSSLATVFLRLPRSIAESRVSLRADHYMPVSLVRNQFADLEPPRSGGNVISIDATLPLQEILTQLESWWRSRSTL